MFAFLPGQAASRPVPPAPGAVLSQESNELVRPAAADVLSREECTVGVRCIYYNYNQFLYDNKRYVVIYIYIYAYQPKYMPT